MHFKEDKMKLYAFKIIIKLFYWLMPKGYSVEIWKWKDEGIMKGAGNALVYTVPTQHPKGTWNAIWNMRKSNKAFKRNRDKAPLSA